MTEVGVIILAAGKGTRMKSDLPKVLHRIRGKSMINYVVECASALFFDNIVVVVGHKAEMVKEEIDRQFKVSYALQKQLIGTGDAVRTALPVLNKSVQHVLVLCGDVPLIKKETLENFVNYHLDNHHDISVLGVTVDKPEGYGRIIFDGDHQFISICEEADATLDQKKIKTVNSGVYCIKKDFLTSALDLIRTDNVQKEYYLTDLVSISFKNDGSTGCFIGNNPEEVMGVNTLEELKKAEQLVGYDDKIR
ncbi:MAG: NTP transferase domain-containing protein [Desulfamplus sp.]|nr:NTP transferase domain-containing protein [Desulfamplus sp.]